MTITTDPGPIRLEKPMLRCEGIRIPGRMLIHCGGGTGVWVTRRARWSRYGYLQCGTCKREQDEMEARA